MKSKDSSSVTIHSLQWLCLLTRSKPVPGNRGCHGPEVWEVWIQGRNVSHRVTCTNTCTCCDKLHFKLSAIAVILPRLLCKPDFKGIIIAFFQTQKLMGSDLLQVWTEHTELNCLLSYGTKGINGKWQQWSEEQIIPSFPVRATYHLCM